MQKKILENWNGISDVEKSAQEQTGDPKAGFNASTFFFGEQGRHLMLPIMYRGKKGKKGEEKFTESYKNIMVMAQFCPFTGKPLYEEAAEKSEENIKSDNSVQVGYWFSDEHGNDVTVLHIFNEWCIVEDDSKEEPYILPLEFISTIKKESDSNLLE